MRGILHKNKHVFNFFKKLILIIRYLKSKHKKAVIENIISTKSTFEIVDKSMHCFYGYYNKNIFSFNDENVIYHKVPIKNSQKSEALIILHNLKTKKEKIISTTNAWNWQQGSMLEWLNNSNDEFIFNNYDDKLGYFSEKHNHITGEKEIFNFPFYCINNDNSRFLSLNFERLQILAPGYGYPIKNKNFDLYEDGVWEYDLIKKSYKRLFTLIELLKYLALENIINSNSCYVNHLEYIPETNDFIFIFRTINKEGLFYSRLLKFNRESNSFNLLIDSGHVSHFCWYSTNILFIYATDYTGLKTYFYLNIITKEMSKYDGDLMNEDGHPSFNIDKKLIVNDTYPSHSRNQILYIYDNISNMRYSVDELFSPIKFFDENRCDLHPRWNNKHDTIAVDTTYTGKRTMKFYKIF